MRLRVFFCLLLAIGLTAPRAEAQSPSTFISGYAKDVRGEIARHESPHPDARSTLVAHAQDPSHNTIEWESAAVPQPMDGGRGPITLALVWSVGVGIGATPAEHARWHIFASDTELATIESPPDAATRDWNIASAHVPGARVEAHLFWADRHAEPAGHLYITLPPSLYTPGKPVRVKVVGEAPPGAAAKGDAWLMVFRYDAEPKATVRAEPALVRDQAGNTRQQLRIDITHFGEPVQAEVRVEPYGERNSLDYAVSGLVATVPRGYTTLRLPIRIVGAETAASVSVSVNRQTLFASDVKVTPVRPVSIYLLHHSHLDIGYTHVQRDVAAMQAKNLEQALALIEKTRGYPADARFKWNVEGFWAVEAFLAQATPEQRARLRAAVQARTVEIGPLYGNMLTGLAQPEELNRMTEAARRFAREAGVPLESAWISDVPGYTWGVVPALAQRGIKYFSLGTNTGDRIGHIIERLGDRPFYWRSASGQERILCWLHAAGYSYFHTGLSYATRANLLTEDRLFNYLRMVQTPDRPAFDLLPLRYNIGSDNGPPDDQLSDLVRAWNEKYVSPHLVIATMTDFFRAFEARHGKTLPVYEGELTPYWEDGAYSTARESIENQGAAARLEQAETFWAMNPRAARAFPADRFREAWRSVLLFNEHTWGSWNSITAPESPFTKSQWATKAAFAADADRQSIQLLNESLGGTAAGAPGYSRAKGVSDAPGASRATTASSVTTASGATSAVDVFNSLSWSRTDLVTVPAAQAPAAAGDRVIDAAGRAVPSQRLSNGDLAFLATDVPALGAKRYRLVPRPQASSPSPHTDGVPSGAGLRAGRARGAVAVDGARASLSGNGFDLALDPATGAIRTLSGGQDTSASGGLNRYLYQAGRQPAEEQIRSASNVRITVGERGPLVASLIAESAAPGTNLLRQEIRLIAGLPRVDIINAIDKRNIYDPEAVYFAFPFAISDPKTRVGLVHGFYRPERQQLPGSCKNYFTMRNWVDVSNSERGVTLVSPDALMLELSRITTDANRVGWLEHVNDSATVFSYVMNNFWGTNYKAGQDGVATFRYAILPHARFDPVRAYKAGLEATHPLVVRSAGAAPLSAPFVLRNRGIIVSAMRPADDGKGIIVRLFNASGRAETPLLQSVKSSERVAVSLVDRDDRPTRRVATPPRLPPFGVLTVYLSLSPPSPSK